MADDDATTPFGFDELTDAGSGLLWLINRTVFHPRGYALAFVADRDEDGERGEPIGWTLQGDGREVWQFTEDTDDEGFAMVRAFFDEMTMARMDDAGETAAVASGIAAAQMAKAHRAHEGEQPAESDGDERTGEPEVDAPELAPDVAVELSERAGQSVDAEV